MGAIIDSAPLYLAGFVATLRLLAISGIGAFLIGLLIAAFRISPIGPLRAFATCYTEILRNIPLLLILFFCAYVLPYLQVRLDFFTLALIGLTGYTSTFVAEAIRSGINGVPAGQAEAARSIGLNFRQTVTLIVLPQAIRTVVPPLINVFIALTKNTSVAGAFFVPELFGATSRATRDHGDAVIQLLVFAALLYLVITVPLGLLANAIERRVTVLR